MCYRDFVRLLADPHLEQRFLARMGTKSQQMGSDLSRRSSSTHCFPSEGHGILFGSGQGGTDKAKPVPIRAADCRGEEEASDRATPWG